MYPCPCGCGAISNVPWSDPFLMAQMAQSVTPPAGPPLTPVQSSCTGQPAELALGAVYAWRRYRVQGGGWLTGARKVSWLSDTMTAGCLELETRGAYLAAARLASGSIGDFSLTGESITAHRAPNEDCTCGIYAFSSPDPANAGILNAADTPTADTVVECWGRTLIGTKGLRAQHARIVAMTVIGAFEQVNVPVYSPVMWTAPHANTALWTPQVVSMRTELRQQPVDPGLLDLLRTRYPDTAVFTDSAQMLAEFPLSDILKDTP